MATILEHALIGDCRSAALVSTSGEINWLCWPRFDSAPLFASLLDPGRGAWRIAPATHCDARQQYIVDTNVLQTTFTTTEAEFVVTDVMPVADEQVRGKLGFPQHEIIRRVECIRGAGDVAFVLEPRPAGHERVALTSRGQLGFAFTYGNEALVLRSERPLETSRAPLGIRGRLHLAAGDVVRFSLVYAVGTPVILPPLGAWTDRIIDESIRWWQRWVGGVAYRGPYRDAVMRSLLMLKLLVFSPSGAIVAAPTTSLPETLGGSLNWDYRYCWLRDASLTIRALVSLGVIDEARSFVNWMFHATQLTRPEVKIMYDVFGRTAPHERDVDWAGFQGSKPVRFGNGARNQTQLDTYGEVIHAATWLFETGRTRPSRSIARMFNQFGEFVCRHWQEPDSGIWELRGPTRHYTHSKVLCWAALDTLLRLHRERILQLRSVAMFEKNVRLIREAVETGGWNASLGAFTQTLDGHTLDASVLLLPWYGFCNASDPRMRSTYETIVRRLGAAPGLLYRFEGEEPRNQGVFLVCGFWAAEYLALGGGTLDEAKAAFENLLRLRSATGLLSEEFDPETRVGLGNFPQGLSHLGLISAALSIAERERKAGKPEHPSTERAA